MRTFVLVLCLFLFASVASAQTNPVPAGQAFQVQYTHDGVNTTGYRCYVDGKPLADLPATARSCAIPGQTAGTHTVLVAAFNAFGEGRSPSVTATAGTPPGAPTNLTITVQVAVQPTGDVTLLTASVAREP